MIFIPTVRRNATDRRRGNDRFLLLGIQCPKDAQPSPQVAISGVWGYVTNKHFRGFAGNGKSSKISKLVQVCIACQFVIPLIVVNNSENVHSKLIVFYGQTKYNIQKSCLTAEKSKKLD